MMARVIVTVMKQCQAAVFRIRTPCLPPNQLTKSRVLENGEA